LMSVARDDRDESLITIVTSHGHQYGLTITEAVLTQFCLS
jgi:hypothetical protein